MENSPTWMAVVALALFDESGRVLLQARPPGKAHAGLWEFPGGKVENGENPRFALQREIAEELAIGINPADLEPLLLADEGAAGPIVLMLYTCTRWRGDIAAREGQRWGWYSFAEARALAMPPIDTLMLARLALAPIAKR